MLTKKAKVLEDKWKQEALLRKKLYNELQDLKGKIRVLCRARSIPNAPLTRWGGGRKHNPNPLNDKCNEQGRHGSRRPSTKSPCPKEPLKCDVVAHGDAALLV